MANTPQVITGARAPWHQRLRQTPRASAGIEPVVPFVIPEGKTVFKFKFAKYRLQLTAPMVKRHLDGTEERPRAIVAVATDYLLTLDNEADKEKIERIRNHADSGKDFWDFADILADDKLEREQEVLKVLEDPESRKRIIEALRASDGDTFALPGSGEKKAGAGSTAAADPKKSGQ